MTHLISPTTFRLGKSSLWKNNFIAKLANTPRTKAVVVAGSTFNGLPLTLKHKLRRKRLLVVKTQVFQQKNILNCRVLYMPRIKTRPKSDSRGSFSRHVLYKNYAWLGITSVAAKQYVDQRRLKVFKFPKKKKKRINKWLSRRMLRVSSLKYGFNVKRGVLNPRKAKRRFTGWFVRYGKGSLRSNAYGVYSRLVTGASGGFNKRWWSTRVKSSSILNAPKLSHAVSNTLNICCNITAVNIFHYLAVKQMLGFRSHQEHLWNKKFRKHRFFYDNYYDIVNSFFILGLVKDSENLALDILRIMMPRIRKIKRFMMFLDSVLKNMPQIVDNFTCFRIVIVGKIRGGTERTKTLGVGFGHLPYQSIALQGSKNFTSYPHKYGEFGVHFIMSRSEINILWFFLARLKLLIYFI